MIGSSRISHAGFVDRRGPIRRRIYGNRLLAEILGQDGSSSASSSTISIG
jgi:hypothetical protein